MSFEICDKTETDFANNKPLLAKNQTDPTKSDISGTKTTEEEDPVKLRYSNEALIRRPPSFLNF